MPSSLSPEVVALLNDPATLKVLATVDGNGAPHAVFKDSLHVADGEIHLLELLESSTTGKNLVRSVWFDRPLAIALRAADGRQFQIKGRAVRTHITGALFQAHYRRLRQSDPDADLAGVWVIAPDAVTDQRPGPRRQDESAAHPGFIHLDRLLKSGEPAHETH